MSELNICLIIAIALITLPAYTWQTCFKTSLNDSWLEYRDSNDIYILQCEEEILSPGFFTRVDQKNPSLTLLLITNSHSPILEKDTFGAPLARLRVLKIEADVQEIQPEALRLFLHHLLLRNNKLTVIKKHYFLGVPFLLSLDLSFNDIVSVEDNSFNKLYRLSKLILKNNFISDTGLPSLVFHGLTSLTILDLSSNLLESIHPQLIDFMYNLEFLYLENNHLVTFDGSVFRKNYNLKLVSISNNFITSVSNLSIASKYAEVNFSNNSINYFTSTAAVLQILDLRFNKIANNLTFDDNIQVSSVVLENNYLGPNLTNPNIFGHLYKLESLSLANSQIQHIHRETFQNTNVKRLNLANNYLQSEDLPKLPDSIMLLNLSYNNFSSNLNITTLINLIHFDASFNLFTEVKFNSFKNLKELTTINLSNNKIVTLTIGCFRDLKLLQVLNLSKNFISTLEMGVFIGLTNLGSLDISYNKLSVFKEGIFHNFRNLLHLQLSYNMIEFAQLKTEIEHLESSLEDIGVAGNGWSCNSLLNFMKTFSSVRFVEHKINVTNVEGVACEFRKSDAETVTKVDSNQIVDCNQQSVVTLLTIIIIVLIVSLFMICFKTLYDIKASKLPGARKNCDQELVLANL